VRDVRRRVDPFEYVAETERLLRGDGILLVSADRAGRPNAMTIGWGLIGTIWRKPPLPRRRQTLKVYTSPHRGVG